MHLTENEILLYLEGKTSKQRKNEIEAHLSECSECTSILSELFSLKKKVDQIEVPDLDNETYKKALNLFSSSSRTDNPGLFKPRLSLVFSIAVALIALSFVFYLYRGDTPKVETRKYRGSDSFGNAIHLYPGENTSINSPTVSLKWNKVKNAMQYRVNVFDKNGNIVFNKVSADTAIHFNSQKLLSSGKTYLWRVEAFYPDGRSETSTVYSFKYAPK